MFFSNKYFIRNVNYLQEALPHRTMGGGDLVLKVIARTLEKRKKRALSFPSSHRSRAAALSERTVVAGKEESCLLLLSVSRDTETGKGADATQLESCSGTPQPTAQGPRGLAGPS